jgi:site-specific DNA recombinase
LVCGFSSINTIDKPVQKLLVEMIKDQLLKQTEKSELGSKHYEKVKNIEDKLVRLQNLYIEGNIEKSEYKIAK